MKIRKTYCGVAGDGAEKSGGERNVNIYVYLEE